MKKQTTSYHTISCYIEPLYATPSDKVMQVGKKRITLRDFQAKVYGELSKGVKERLGIFLEALTGAGKTYILLTLLAIKNYNGIVGIYPTKILAKDQYDTIYNELEDEREIPLKELGMYRTIKELLKDKNIRKLFEEKGLPREEQEFITLREIKIVSPQGEEFTRRVLLLLLTSETTETLRLLMDKRTKREVFIELVRNLFFKVDFVMIFTVPEYPYIFHEMTYGEFEREGEKLWRILKHYKDFLNAIIGGNDVQADRYIEKLKEVINYYRQELGVTRDSLREMIEIYAGLFRYPLFIDEFHLYSDLSEISLLALLFMYYAFYPYAKTIFSSATPKEKLQELIKIMHRLFGVKTLLIKAVTSNKGEKEHLIRGKTKVVFYGVSTGTGGLAGLLKAQRFVPEIAHEIASKEPDKKTMIILDRVGLVLDTCKHVRDAVGEKKELIYVTSIKVPTEYCREINIKSIKKGGYDYIIGNLAIAQGIDLKHIERGIVYAKDIMSFIQKFGRVPRGRNGEIHVIVEWKRLGKLKALDGKTISYQDLIHYLREHKVLPDPTEISWLKTYLGFIKLTFPIFTYVLRSAIAYIDEKDTKYDRLRNALPKLADLIREYFKLFKPTKSINDFLKLISFQIDFKLMGNYITFYRLMSFRDILSAKIEVESSKGKYLREQSLIVSIRNFLMSKRIEHKDAVLKVNLEERNFYIPFLLMDEVYEDDEEELLKHLRPFNNSILNLALLLNILSKYDFYLAQVSRDNRVKSLIYIRELEQRIVKTELADTPIFLKVRSSKNDNFENHAMFMVCTREAFPIGVCKRGIGAKILGLAILV